MAPTKKTIKAVQAPLMKKAMKDAKKKMNVLGKWKGPTSTSTSLSSAPPTPPPEPATAAPAAVQAPVPPAAAPVQPSAAPAKPSRRPPRRDLHQLPKFLEVPSEELLAQLFKGSRHHLMAKHYCAKRKLFLFVFCL